MTHKFHHVHIKAKDPRKSANWWADMFGAKLMPERENHGILFVPLEIGGVLINFSNAGPDEKDKIGEGDVNPHYGLEHIGLSTDDLDADVAHLKKDGWEIFRVLESPANKIAFVETPDNVRLELIQFF